MPELPEVEYTARQLRATVIGKTIQDAAIFWERTIGHPDIADFLAQIAGRTIERVRRRGKFLLFDLSGNLFLTIHRRMTGNFLLLPAGWEIDTHLRETDPATWSVKGPSFKQTKPTVEGCVSVVTRAITLSQTLYCRVCLNFTDGERLLFTDPRKFGRVELWSRSREEEAFAGLGPEPLDAAFTLEHFTEALRRRKTSIKSALLAQDLVVGLGNIYADEALFYASLHPLRRTNFLTSEEIRMLHEGIITVLTNGIEHGGTSFNDYRDLWGEAGDNYNHVRVYQKDGTPCVRCGTLIERIVVTQRSTHFCPTCQKPILE
ncbi:MAG: bifunctional DNA-formamidopyrimidine glycosylase/DNA-(apurinic or apyrimidinic site) lyase [Ktedonobacteraceae bacterium]